MRFNSHSELTGLHAFLSASKYHWINYPDAKLDERYLLYRAAAHGTRLHEFAAEAIKLGVKLPSSRKTLNMYINDAIGFKLVPEQILYYSEHCFGTADAIGYNQKKRLLRIHDLKTGVTLTSEHQLEVYAALFCLEYRFKPHEIDIEMRIYQNDECRIYIADPDTIAHIMDKIVTFSKRIDQIRDEVD